MGDTLQSRPQRRSLGLASLLGALLVNGVLFGILALVNGRVKVDAARALPDPAGVHVRYVRADQPPPQAAIVEPEDSEAEPLEPMEPPEPMELAIVPEALQPRIPLAARQAFDPLGIPIAVSDLHVEAAAADTGPMDLPDVDTPPRRTVGALPDYPYWAQSRGLEAYLTVEFVVNADGTVSEVRCTHLEGDERFRSMAVEAVRAWRFEPATLRGRSVPVRCFKKMRYRLED